VPHISGGQVNTDNHIKIMINFVHLTESIDVGSRNHIGLNDVIMSLGLAHTSYGWWPPNHIKAVINIADYTSLIIESQRYLRRSRIRV
jgi:hypothetical protein